MVDRIPSTSKPSTIKAFDPNACRLLRHDLDQALAPIAAKFGITLSIGKMTYSESNVRMSLEAATIGEGGIVMSRKASDFKALASLYGFEADDLGKTFIVQGTQYRITGLNQRAEKMPVLGERVKDGRGFKFPEATVLRAMGRSTATQSRSF